MGISIAILQSQLTVFSVTNNLTDVFFLVFTCLPSNENLDVNNARHDEIIQTAVF